MLFFVGLHDQLQCPECSYRGEKSQNVARHIALVHSKLDALLADKNLVNKRRQEYQSKPNKINIGSECPVCDQQLTKQHSRVHVIWHFMEELREIVQTFADPTVSYHFEYQINFRNHSIFLHCDYRPTSNVDYPL